VIDVMLLTSDEMPSPDGLMESLHENQLSLLALAIGAFGIGTTEFSPMGLLPVIAKGVDVSIPAAGMLISAYAIGVMVGAPLMTLLLSHARAEMR
jgi:predicted MFS family arabinose efflux permease